MLVIVLLLIIIAISLTYFNQNALESTAPQTFRENDLMLDSTSNPTARAVNSISTTALWKRIAVVLLICTLPLLWEGRTYENAYLYNGLLLSTNRLNLVVWLLLITGLALITIISLQDNLTDSVLIESGQNERIVFTLCAILGGIILNSAQDFLTILLGLELQSYSVYILAASYRNYEPSEAAGLKYFLLGALSSALVFMGLAILYTYSGSTNLDIAFLMLSSVHILDSSHQLSDTNNYLALEYNAILPYIGVVLILAGISWKVAAAPVQAWSIDVYDAVPTRTTAILSLIPKIALFSLLIRLISMLTIYTIDSSETGYLTSTFLLQHKGVQNTGLQIIILVVALSLIIGSVAGLFQPRIKRLLAYSSVLNVGFILMSAVLSNSVLDHYNPTLYIIQYIITTAAIWLCLVNLANVSSNYSSNTTSQQHPWLDKGVVEVTLISQLQGIHTNPLSNNNNILNSNTTVIAICITALILSTAGIPPMVGFYAKYSVILLALQSGYSSLALLAVLASIISTVYYLGVIRAIWGRSSILPSIRNIGIHITAMSTSINRKSITRSTDIESSLFISLFSLIVVLFFLQYSVVYVLISL